MSVGRTMPPNARLSRKLEEMAADWKGPPPLPGAE